MLTLQIRQGRKTMAKASHKSHAQLFFQGDYPEGATITLKAPAGHVWLQVDAAIPPALIYLPSGAFTYRLPKDDEPGMYPPGAFRGPKHLLRAWLPSGDDLTRRRNLALNPLDQRGESSAYPRATANVETRNEAQFAARNVIDGWTIADKHGHWPYQSWGIGGREDACLTIDFGREVLIDEIALVLRADFPHDAYWTQATIVFSDDSLLLLDLDRTGEPQVFGFDEKRISWLRLEKLIKSVEPSPFPALIELEAYGTEA